MLKHLVYALIVLFLTPSLFAKTLDQKKNELKKVYEAGGISKIEYKKSIKFLENPKNQEGKKKKSISFTKKKEKKSFFKKEDKEEKLEEITLEKIDQLGKPVKLDDTNFTEGMMKILKGCSNSLKCKGKKAGGQLAKTFKRSKSYSQRNPGKMIKAMAMYEVFYASKLWYARKSIERYKENNYQKSLSSKKKKDEKEIRSLFGMNKGRISMREALGMDSNTPTKVAIKKFWLLGEFLDLGTGVKNKKLDKDLKKRQKLLEAYKLQIVNLKKKLQDDIDEKENEKSVE